MIGCPAGLERALAPGPAERRRSAMRSRTARLAIALLVGVAGWATGGPYGQGQSAGRRTTSPEAATAFGWRLPDWMAPPPVPADNPMSAGEGEVGPPLFFCD